MQGDVRGFALARGSGLGRGARNIQVAALNRANLTEIMMASGVMLIGSCSTVEFANEGAWGLPIAWNYSRKVLDVLPCGPWLTMPSHGLPLQGIVTWVLKKAGFSTDTLVLPVQGEGLFGKRKVRLNFWPTQTVSH